MLDLVAYGAGKKMSSCNSLKGFQKPFFALLIMQISIYQETFLNTLIHTLKKDPMTTQNN